MKKEKKEEKEEKEKKEKKNVVSKINTFFKNRLQTKTTQHNNNNTTNNNKTKQLQFPIQTYVIQQP